MRLTLRSFRSKNSKRFYFARANWNQINSFIQILDCVETIRVCIADRLKLSSNFYIRLSTSFFFFIHFAVRFAAEHCDFGVYSKRASQRDCQTFLLQHKISSKAFENDSRNRITENKQFSVIERNNLSESGVSFWGYLHLIDRKRVRTCASASQCIKISTVSTTSVHPFMNILYRF